LVFRGGVEVKRRIAVTLLVANIVLGSVAAWECGDGVAPKAECQDGSRKASHSGNKTKLYECHNGSWLRVTCYNGTTKAERGKNYICRSNEWRRTN